MNGKVDASECWIYTATHTITSGDPDPLDNVVTVRALDSENDVISNTDDHVTDILPDLSELIYLPIIFKNN